MFIFLIKKLGTNFPPHLQRSWQSNTSQFALLLSRLGFCNAPHFSQTGCTLIPFFIISTPIFCPGFRLCFPQSFRVAFCLVACVANTDKISLGPPFAVHIYLAQCQLWMQPHIVYMMHMVGSRVSAFALAYLALVLVLRQYFPPQLAPLWRYIKLMNVARCYQLADISLCHLSLNFSQRPCAYIIVLHANTSVKCAINLLLSHRYASLSPAQSSATLRPYRLYRKAPAAVQAAQVYPFGSAAYSTMVRRSLCNCY